MPHTADIVTYRGYPFEEHVHQTSDGFLLALHRIPHGKNQAKTKRNKQGKGKPPVLLWHGFMMNSEVWVCQPEEQNSLAFQLAEQGYDVWLANSRGNKYSCKHVQHTPQQDRYWKFGLDELVMIDVPETVDVSTLVLQVLRLAGTQRNLSTTEPYSNARTFHSMS